MIVAWPTLTGWVETRRVDEQRRRQIEAAAAQWIQRGRGPRGLLDPMELADVEAWQRTESACELGLSAEATALAAASRAQHDRQRRWRRVAVWSAFTVFAALAVSAAFAIRAHRDASKAESSRKQLEVQRYQEIGRQSLLAGHPQKALPYLIAAREKGGQSESLRMMIWTAAHWLPLDPSLKHLGRVLSAAFSPGGTLVATASDDGIVRIWDVTTGKLVTPPLEHPGLVRSAAFSADGTRIVTSSAKSAQMGRHHWPASDTVS